MRMMQFIALLVKNNSQIREHFIDVLRRAMYQSNISTRQMGVYGFCLVLKSLRNNTSWRGTSRLGATQFSISGFSVMSQQTIGSGNNSNTAFDMSVLEIIGILRKCFGQKYEIKEILYDGLFNSIQQNSKLIPHVLQFLDWHFRNYFNELGDFLEIDFEKCVSEVATGELKSIQVNDHIGKLLYFITHCIILLDQHNLEFDATDLKEFFDKLIQKIHTISMEQIGLVSA